MDKHNVFNTNLFHYHKEEREFTQEASTLKIPPGYVLPFITLRNPKTKGTRRFEMLHTIKADNGEDIGGWEYLSTEGELLTIWND